MASERNNERSNEGNKATRESNKAAQGESASAAAAVPVITFEGSPFRLHQPFAPAGDQPEAFACCVKGWRMA